MPGLRKRCGWLGKTAMTELQSDVIGFLDILVGIVTYEQQNAEKG